MNFGSSMKYMDILRQRQKLNSATVPIVRGYFLVHLLILCCFISCGKSTETDLGQSFKNGSNNDDNQGGKNASNDGSSNNSSSNNSGDSPAKLAAPTGLTLTQMGATQMDLRWRDNSDNETGFDIERADATSGFQFVTTVGSNQGTGDMSFSDTGLAPNTTYMYRVRAVNGSTPSDYSNESSGKTTCENGQVFCPS